SPPSASPCWPPSSATPSTAPPPASACPGTSRTAAPTTPPPCTSPSTATPTPPSSSPTPPPARPWRPSSSAATTPSSGRARAAWGPGRAARSPAFDAARLAGVGGKAGKTLSAHGDALGRVADLLALPVPAEALLAAGAFADESGRLAAVQLAYRSGIDRRY